MSGADLVRGLASPRAQARRASVGAVVPLLLAGTLTGCAAGPDFSRPTDPDVDRYTTTPLPAQTASTATRLGGPQRFDVEADLSPQWWRAFAARRLDAWIERAVEASPTLESAKATLRQAREIYSARAGSTLYPKIDAGLAAQRQRMNPNALGQESDPREFSLYDAGIGVRYRLDLAGGNRRALEALAARAEYRRYELESARLTLAANITMTALARARLAGQIEAALAMVDAQDEELALTRERVRLGHGSPDEVLALQAQVERSRAELPLLRNQLEQSEHFLAVLAGQAPGAAKVPDFNLDEFNLPSDLPVILPSELMRRRPDILAAEALLHAANAEYGVAVANLYPRLDLSASLSSQALSTEALFGGASAVWNVLGQLTQPLFNPGLSAEKRASLAALDAAAANYQEVVLYALRDVADALRALDHDAQALAALAAADQAAQDSLASVARRYALGAASYVEVLIARQQAHESRIGLIEAQAQRLADSAALYQVLGGGTQVQNAGST